MLTKEKKEPSGGDECGGEKKGRKREIKRK
jgi:hypothetical protein